MLSEHLLQYGYWPSRQLSGQNPSPLRHPDEYNGSDVVNISCTQTGLPASQQRRLVDAWCSILPTLPARTVLFTTKVTQELFEAAAANPGLEALFLKWSSIESLEPLAYHPRVEALHVGESRKLTGLHHLGSMPILRHVFLEGISESSDLRFAGSLTNLTEFGLAGLTKPLQVASLEPLQAMTRLAILWLVNVQPKEGGLGPLHRMQSLHSFRTTMNLQSEEIQALLQAVPSIRYLQPVR